MNPVKEIIKKYKIKPSKKLGQNFLIDKNALRKIIKTAELKPDDIVLEIGPGIGNLTKELARRVKKVIAIEKDTKMVEILEENLKEFKNVEIIQGDILKFLSLNSKFEARSTKPRIARLRRLRGRQIRNLNVPMIQTNKVWNIGELEHCDLFRISDFGFRNSYKVVANIPYYLTSPLIRKFLETVDVRRQQSRQRPKLMVLMVQKEVAQRICPRPPKLKERRRGKTPKMNILAISVQFYAKPEIVTYVSKNSFWPKPKVDSAILKISRIGTNLPQINTNLFFRIVKAGFSQPRKQIVNNLVKGLKLDKEKVKNWLLKNNIQPSQRAETLKIEDWLNLTKCYKIKQ